MLNKEQVLKTAEEFARVYTAPVILVYGAAGVVYGAKTETNDLDIYLVTDREFNNTGWEWLPGSVNPVIWKRGIYDIAIVPTTRLNDVGLVKINDWVWIYDLETTIKLRRRLVNKLGREKDSTALAALLALKA